MHVHWGTLVIIWLFTWSLTVTLPEHAPGHPPKLYWAAGACLWSGHPRRWYATS